MKFKKETPKRSGIYWYVDTEYPEPMICWFNAAMFSSGDTMYILCGGSKQLTQIDYDHYRWGDEIIAPSPVDNEIED